MKLWKKAAGALKDQNSIWMVTLSRRSVYRNPDLEAAIIRATSHDESYVDYKNVQRVFAWVRMSPTYLKPLVKAISTRMERTGCWAVALKGLMLMHGIFCCKIPAVRMIGRLPFDLSNFSDSHLSPEKSWGHSMLVRTYFTFLDQKSALLCAQVSQDAKRTSSAASGCQKPMITVMMAKLLMLQELQSLLDLLLQIKPQADGIKRSGLVLEAMDCIIIEIFDVYSKICTLIATILSRIYDSTREEASTVLNVLHQGNKQAKELSHFFELCNSLGVLNASEFPKVEQVPVEDMEEVQRVIDRRISSDHVLLEIRDDVPVVNTDDSKLNKGNSRAIIVREMVRPIIPYEGTQKFLTTVVTDKWEVFEDEALKVHTMTYSGFSSNVKTLGAVVTEPLAAKSNVSNNHVQRHKAEIPDFITF